MKKTYEVPKLMIEMFTPNAAIATCAVSKEWAFDCMKGKVVDYISTAVAQYEGLSCTQNVGINTSAIGARDYDGGTNHTKKYGSWTEVYEESTGENNQGWPDWGQNNKKLLYVQVTYNNPDAVLFCDSNGSNSTPTTTAWGGTSGVFDGETSYLKRSGDGGTHHLVAPVKSVQAMS